MLTIVLLLWVTGYYSLTVLLNMESLISSLPLLFLLHINELDLVFSSMLYLYIHITRDLDAHSECQMCVVVR